MKTQFKRGDRVALKAAFLRSIMDFSHASASKRGTVLDVLPVATTCDLIELVWDGEDEKPISRVLSTNLIHADRIHLEPA